MARRTHECACATLPADWPKCGKTTTKTWGRGCDGTTEAYALQHLGFPKSKDQRVDFVRWAATQPRDAFRGR